MQRPHGTARLRFLKCLIPLLVLSMAGCADFRAPALEKLQGTTKDKSPKKPGQTRQQAADEALLAAAERASGIVPAKATAGSSVDLTFLLSMDYTEAKAISTQSAETSKGTKIAADKIEVLKTDKEGKAKKLTAKGKVYIETGAADGAKILCQEAYINGDEAILRGKPIMQRGGSIVEGLDEGTVFYMLGTRLRVIGLHRLTNEGAMLANLPDLGPWTGGPNPLLPPLNEGSVPRNIRAEMLKAAEAEAVLQQAKLESLDQPAAPPAPWIKD
ncbi:MAG: hypothetical protein U0984_03625, partial [Prosthecobacter sp.]|nr:hypothetical protein [Prosthecobacter sp.]